MARHREIEVKLAVAPDVALPDLTGLPGVAAVEHHPGAWLEAVYMDTPDLRLARANTTLRRRTGGTDAGWHLKLPVSARERLEVRAPLGSADDGAPAELLSAVRARTRTAPLSPAAVLRTQRTVHLLLNAAGSTLSEVADDAVTSSGPGAGDHGVDAWREWEVELVDGDEYLLASAVLVLQSAGAAVPSWPSKLARALGARLTAAAAAASEADTVSPVRAREVELVCSSKRHCLGRRIPLSVHRARIGWRKGRDWWPPSRGPGMTGTAVFDLAVELEAAAPRHVRVARDTKAIYIWNIQVHDVGDGRPRVLFGGTSSEAVPYPRGLVTISGSHPAIYETGAMRVLAADGVGALQGAFDAAVAAGDPLTAVRARLLDRSAGLEPPIVVVMDPEALLAMA